MSDLSEPTSVTVSLGASGVCPPVEFGGKTYRLGHPTQVAKADYELGIIEAEKRSIAQQLKHGIISPAEAAAERSKLGSALDRGDQKAGKPLWLAYTFGHPETGDTSRVMTGLMIYVHGLFRQNHPDLTFADVGAIWDGAGEDLKLAMKQVVPSFFTWAADAMSLPPDARAQIAATVETMLGGMFPVPATSTTPTPTLSS